jgi:hypothetical protein
MNSVVTSTEKLAHPRSQTAFRTVKQLAGGYLSLSVATLAAIIVLRHHTSMVNSAVWIRGSIVVVSALVTLALTLRAASGSRRAYLRLRIISTVMVLAIAIIIALPGPFPVWLKVEQGICGVLLIGVAAIVNGTHLRSVFSGRD